MSRDVDTQSFELEQLRARVALLEAELAEVEARANRAVAEAQAKTYWLDRWHVDLNALIDRRGAERVRAVARAVRTPLRALRKFKLRLLP